MKKMSPDPKKLWHFEMLAMGAVALVLFVGGYGYYRFESKHIREDKYRDLAAIARLKAEQIALWRAERLADANRASRGPLLQRALKDLIVHPTSVDLKKDLRECLLLEQEASAYSDVQLLSPDGVIMVAIDDHPDGMNPTLRVVFDEALAMRKPVLSGLYRCADHGVVHIDAVAPVLDDDGDPMAVLILRANAKTFLYPMIASWPTPSRSAETLLVERQGDEVLFLTQLRHQPVDELTLRVSVHSVDIPAVQAVLGRRGLVQGKDYRGVDVLADLLQVPDSPWLMVAKVDTDELLAEAKYRAGVITGFVCLCLLLVGVMMLAYSRKRHVGFYQKLYAEEQRRREAQEEFRTTLYSIGDAVITTDTAGRVRQMNRVAEELTGWEETEACGRPLNEVFHIVSEETRETAENPVERVIAEGNVVGLANHTLLIARDGTERPIADSGAPVKDNKGVITGVVLVFRDQTSERIAQQALRESVEYFRRLFDNTMLGVAIHQIVTNERGEAVDYVFLQANRAFEKHTGLRVAEIVGKRATEVVPGIEKTGLIHTYGKVALSGEPVAFEAFVEPLRRYFNVTAYQVIPGHFATIFEDITEHKRSDERLRVSEERFRTLVENAPDAIFIQVDGRFAYLNQACVRLLGGTAADDFLGASVPDAFHPDCREVVRERMRILNEHKRSVERVEETILRKDGKSVEVDVSAVPFRFEEKDGALVFVRDITEQKRALRNLRESEAQYRTLADSGQALIWTSGIDKKCDYFNQPWLAFTGRTLAQELGDGWTEGVHPEDFAACVETYVRAFDRRERFSMDYRLRRYDGEYRWIQDDGTPRYNSQGEFVGYIGHCLDITDRKSAEAEREKLETQLLQSQKMEAVGRLAGGVAHDFNNMLQVIQGYTDMLLAELPPKEAITKDLQEISKAARRSAELTRQLLAFARKQTVALKVLNINETIADMLRMLRRLLGEDLDLMWHPSQDPWLVKMDPSQINQILTNLAVNARDAITGVGKLTIEVGTAEFDIEYCRTHAGFIPGQYVRLAVSDDGCGMDEETMAHIFEPFFTTKTAGKGSGLGLAMVYGIVRQNGGFINVYSEKGKGSTFKIYLPRYTGASAVAVETTEVSTALTGTETVLLVDDEESMLVLGRRMLEQLGYTVLTATGPFVALEMVSSHEGPIDLLMTDVVMPGMSGRELAEHILAERPACKVLYMSGYTANVIAHRAILDEGVTFLSKPFSKVALAVELRKALAMP